VEAEQGGDRSQATELATRGAPVNDRRIRNSTVAYIELMDHEPLLRTLYANFNAREVGAVLAATTPDVDWPNAWEGGRVRGREAVREYWRRQWAEIDPTVEPRSIVTRPDGRVAVEVHQVVRSLEGDLIGENDVMHVYELRGGLISRMTVEEDGVEE
jgi:hypothetical protein